MKIRSRNRFTPEYKLEATRLVFEQDYSVREAAEAMGIGKSTLDRWVRQRRNEESGIPTEAAAVTIDKRRIQELERRLRRVEMEKEILKKATALLISDEKNHF